MDRISRVAVAGGELVVHELGAAPPDVPESVARESAPIVLAVHGITANAMSWRPVERELHRRTGVSGVRFLAVDVRGRACSRSLGPPYSLSVDADDVLSVARAHPGAPLVVVGHSMGAYVAALAAAAEPGLVSRVVLVDGGLAFPTPPGLDLDDALAALLGPSLQRLGMRFADEEAYLQFWQPHPAVGPLLSGSTAEDVRAYLLHDLVPAEDGSGQLGSSCVREAIRCDGAGLLDDPETHAAVAVAAGRGVRLELLWAARGLMDEPQGIYDEARLVALNIPTSVRTTAVPDSNHFSIQLHPRGVTAVVDALERAIDMPERTGP